MGWVFIRPFDSVLANALASKTRIYSAAYIMPSRGGGFGYRQKHRNHLKLLGRMMEDEVPYRIADASSMRRGFEILRFIPIDRGLLGVPVRYRPKLQ